MAKNVEFYNWNLGHSDPVNVTLLKYDKPRQLRIPDMHSALHLGIILDGEINSRFGREELNFSSNSVYLTAPWELHQSGIIRYSELLLITLDSRGLENFFTTCQSDLHSLLQMSPKQRMAYINQHPDVETCINELISSAHAPQNQRWKLRMWHSVLNFFINIMPEHPEFSPANNDYDRLLPVLEKLGPRMIPLKTAAELCNLSVSRFSALFKKFSGLSFSKYERNFRLNGAAGSIRGGATLKEAAEMWDFCDKSHLARLLKNS